VFAALSSVDVVFAVVVKYWAYQLPGDDSTVNRIFYSCLIELHQNESLYCFYLGLVVCKIRGLRI